MAGEWVDALRRDKHFQTTHRSRSSRRDKPTDEAIPRSVPTVIPERVPFRNVSGSNETPVKWNPTRFQFGCSNGTYILMDDHGFGSCLVPSESQFPASFRL